MKIKSGVSQTHWCSIDSGIARFEPASIAIGSLEATAKEKVSWFDRLFEGGIELPDPESTDSRPLTMLIAGPPGSGKTTLAAELCYRLAKNEQENAISLFSLYISTDSTTSQFIDNAQRLGWENTDVYFQRFTRPVKRLRGKKPPKPPYSHVLVWGREAFQSDQRKSSTVSELVATAIEGLEQWLIRTKSPKITEMLRGAIEHKPLNDNVTNIAPDILVVDNLNIVEPQNQGDRFQEFLKACKARQLVIFILDSGESNSDHKFWEYFCDIVVRMDYTYLTDYYVRTIEVIKARYQAHLWGKHQLKIYAKPALPKSPDNARRDDDTVKKYNTTLRRAHPYLDSGGIFIYPSIHSYLSSYKRQSSFRALAPSETYPEKLNQILSIPTREGIKGGIPNGRCTAFIGPRGGHKSHLGFLHVLHRLYTDRQEGGLIVSLREDEGVTKSTLRRIMRQEFQEEEKVEDFERENRLEVLYYAPGYITPEEFFHRMFISIQRLRMANKSLTVMFNSLDQLSARFPLCAKQEIFIPGIIQALSADGITSICLAVNEPGQPIEQYGLLPMADLILSFSRRRFLLSDYLKHVNESWNLHGEMEKEERYRQTREYYLSNAQDRYHESVVLEVVRLAGGKGGGARGMLELVNQDELEDSLYPRAGLHFTPLSWKYSQGDLIATGQ